MSKQANKTLIGGFVIGAVALFVVAIVIFGSGKFLTKTYSFVLYFEGSVKGLNVGAPVLFRGVKIGSVTDITIFAEGPGKPVNIPVIIEIERDKFHRRRGERPVDPHKNIAILKKDFSKWNTNFFLGHGNNLKDLRFSAGYQSLQRSHDSE